jgi:hypothetical protein
MTIETQANASIKTTPSRPNKLTYVVGAALFALFIVFVLSQSATITIPQ